MPTEREYFDEIREMVFKKAIADGFQVVIPTSNQLQLDIDCKWPEWLISPITQDGSIVSQIIHNKNKKMSSVLNRFLLEFLTVKWEAWKSGGGNCHVVLTLDRELETQYRIALQSILGSDPMREFLNLRRVLCGADDPIALFKPPTDKKEL